MSPDSPVLVVGSGAAGLLAGMLLAREGRRVTLIERSEHVGGTSALSGGRIWLPANGTPGNREDSLDRAARYLTALLPPRSAEAIDSFLGTVPDLLEALRENTVLSLVACEHYPDYHPDVEGSMPGTRTLDIEPLDTRELAGPQELVLLPPGYLPVTHAEWEQWRYPRNYDMPMLRDRLERGIRTGGPALVAGLLDGAVRAGVDLRTGIRLTGLTQAENGWRARVEDAEGSHEWDAAAVVIATGGFDRNDGLRAEHLPSGVRVSGSAPGNTGDALRIAQDLDLPLANLGEGWWMPMISIPGDEIDGHPYPRSLVRERGAPRQIIVDQTGQRVVDEAAPYNELGKGLNRALAGASTRLFLVFDQQFRRLYGLPGLPSDGDVPEWVYRGETLGDLARAAGIDADGLEYEVSEWNSSSVLGKDLRFARGDSIYDRYYGDPGLEPAPNFGPIDAPPYFAVELFSGTIGSKGGPVTNTNGQAVRRDGTTLPTLAFVGNASVPWIGDAYPGPGATLAVGMVAALRAARSLTEPKL